MKEISIDTKEGSSLIKQNPHIEQCSKYILKNYNHKIKVEDSIKITHSNGKENRLPYESNIFQSPSDVKSVIHWGQRKLLMCEIDFLSRYGHRSDIVIYPGAAPATHTPFLASLFPKHTFILYDPAPFSIKPTSKIIIRRQLFTDEDCVKLRSEYNKVLIICDVRRSDNSNIKDKDLSMKLRDEFVKEDMDLQKNWVLLLQAEVSMLKFNLPWKDQGFTEYFDGSLEYQCWAPGSTTETRLIVDRKDNYRMKLYNDKAYEDEMFYHNLITRGSTVYKSGVTYPLEGIDRCFDCTREFYILKNFLMTSGRPTTNQDVINFMVMISNKVFGGKKHLSDKNINKVELRNIIEIDQGVIYEGTFMNAADYEDFMKNKNITFIDLKIITTEKDYSIGIDLQDKKYLIKYLRKEKFNLDLIQQNKLLPFIQHERGFGLLNQKEYYFVFEKENLSVSNIILTLTISFLELWKELESHGLYLPSNLTNTDFIVQQTFQETKIKLLPTVTFETQYIPENYINSYLQLFLEETSVPRSDKLKFLESHYTDPFQLKIYYNILFSEKFHFNLKLIDLIFQSTKSTSFKNLLTKIVQNNLNL